MSTRDPLTGRFRVVQPTPPEGRQTFTGLDTFTAALVARSPKVEPAQPLILPVPSASPAPAPQPSKTAPAQPSPVLIGGLGAALGLGLAALLKGVSRG